MADHDSDPGAEVFFDDEPGEYDDGCVPEDGPLEERHATVQQEHVSYDVLGAPQSHLTYFDERLQHIWAGPDHWKVRRPRALHCAPSATEPKRAARKETATIDFFTHEVDLATLYAKANPGSITLSKAALEERATVDNLLPKDLRFSSSEFLRLFTKPRWKLGARTRTAEGTVQKAVSAAEEVPAEYWATQHAVSLDGPSPPPVDSNDACLDSDPAEWNDDIASTADGESSARAEGALQSNYADALVAPFKSLQATTLEYARVAKRVNVQKLKDALWDQIALDTKAKSKIKFQPTLHRWYVDWAAAQCMQRRDSGTCQCLTASFVFCTWPTNTAWCCRAKPMTF